MQRELDCIPCQFVIFGGQTVWIISSREQYGLLYVGVPSLPLHSYHPTCSGCQEPVGSLGEYHLGESLKQELKRGAYRGRKTAGQLLSVWKIQLGQLLGKFFFPRCQLFSRSLWLREPSHLPFSHPSLRKSQAKGQCCLVSQHWLLSGLLFMAPGSKH